MLQLGQSQFQEAKTKEYKLFLSQLIAACFYYNAELAMALVEQQQSTAFVFSHWLKVVPLYRQRFELRRSILAFLAIAALPENALPEMVRMGLPDIVKNAGEMVVLSAELRKRAEKRASEAGSKSAASGTGKSEEEAEVVQLNVEDDWGDDEEDDEDYECEEEMLLYTSPVDNLDEIKIF